MRRRVPRQRARPFRALGAAHRAARQVRGQPGRVHHGRCPAGRPALRPRLHRLARRDRPAPEAAPSAHSVLGVQSLPHPGGLRRQAVLSQRPGDGPAHALRRGVRQGLLRGCAEIQSRARLSTRRRSARHPAPPPVVASRRRGGTCLRGRVRADAGRAGSLRSGPAGHLRGSGTGGERALGRARGGRDGRRRHCGLRAHLAAGGGFCGASPSGCR